MRSIVLQEETDIEGRTAWAAKKLQTLIQIADDGGTGALTLLLDELSEAVFVVDAARNLLLFNRQAESITGYARNEVLGRHCLTGVKCARCLERCGIFDRGQIRGVPIDLIRRDGKTVKVIKNASVLRNQAGEVIGAIEMFRPARPDRAPPDYGEIARRDSPLYSEAATWEGLGILMSSLGRAFLVLDEQFVIERTSATVAQLVGMAPDALVGRLAADVLGIELCAPDSPFRAGLAHGARREGWRAMLQRADGTKQPVSISGAPLAEDPAAENNEGSPARFLVIIRPQARRDESVDASGKTEEFEGMVARSPAMHRVFQLVDHLHDNDASVLITGESGTGKELVARSIHARSIRANRPFVAINCGALPDALLESELFGHARGAFTGAIRDKPGRFEVADDGTVFLDEIGDLPLPLQVKLLRVLEAKTYERVGETRTRELRARVVAATHRNLSQLVDAGLFREDLFYRLNVVPIVVPPLRERREDIEVLIFFLLDKIGRRRSRSLRLSPSAIRALMTHHWPGNVRQLENALEYATALCGGQTIHKEDLPTEIITTPRPPDTGPRLRRPALAPAPAPTAVLPPPPARPAPRLPAPSHDAALIEDGRYPTRDQVLAALEACRYRRGEAAARLGVSRTTLWRRMRVLGLE